MTAVTRLITKSIVAKEWDQRILTSFLNNTVNFLPKNIHVIKNHD